jgi:hypothetical protein
MSWDFCSRFFIFKIQPCETVVLECCFLIMFPKGGQTRKHIASKPYFPKGKQTKKQCSLAMFPPCLPKLYDNMFHPGL